MIIYFIVYAIIYEICRVNFVQKLTQPAKIQVNLILKLTCIVSGNFQPWQAMDNVLLRITDKENTSA